MDLEWEGVPTSLDIYATFLPFPSIEIDVQSHNGMTGKSASLDIHFGRGPSLFFEKKPWKKFEMIYFLWQQSEKFSLSQKYRVSRVDVFIGFSLHWG